LLLRSLENMAINKVKLKTLLSPIRPEDDFPFGGDSQNQISQWWVLKANHTGQLQSHLLQGKFLPNSRQLLIILCHVA